jgi:hypothetical protein
MGVLDDAIREHLELKRRHGVPEEEVERQEEEALGPARRDVAQQPEGEEAAADADDDASLFDAEHRDAPVAEAPAAADEETAVAEPSAAEAAPVLEEPSAVEEPPAVEERPLPSEQPPVAVEPTPVEPTPVVPPVSSAPPVEAPPEAEPPVADHTGLEPPPAEPEPAPEPAEPPAPEPPRVELGPEPDPDPVLGDTEPHGFPAVEGEDIPEEDHEDDDSHALTPEAADAEDEELDVLEDTPDFLQETPEHDRLWFEQKPPRDFDFD